MTPREVKLVRRLTLDYMLIGIALGGSREVVGKHIQPNEMITDVGKMLMQCVLEGEFETFREYLASKRDFIFQENEGICQGIVRMVKQSNVDQYSYAVGDAMGLELQKFADVDDVIGVLERATVALKAAKEERESVT